MGAWVGPQFVCEAEAVGRIGERGNLRILVGRIGERVGRIGEREAVAESAASEAVGRIAGYLCHRKAEEAVSE